MNEVTRHDFLAGEAVCTCRGGLCLDRKPATGFLVAPGGKPIPGGRYAKECAQKAAKLYRDALDENWRYVPGIRVEDVFTGNVVIRFPRRGAFHVNLYRTDRQYGGPEEGGWHYDTGRFEACVGLFDDRKVAMGLFEALEASAWLKERKAGLHAPSSVLSEAEWPLLMVEDHAGRDYPRNRPRYE